MVTMKWWDDLWLNEGFASLLMYFAMDAIYPEWNVVSISKSKEQWYSFNKEPLIQRKYMCMVPKANQQYGFW